jgi:hypothetical protein
MPAPVTLAALRQRVLRRADMVLQDFVDTAPGDELDTYIRESAREFYDILVNHHGEDYFYATANLVTVPGVPTVALPSNCYKVLGVDALVPGAVGAMVLDRFEWDERGNMPTSGWDWYATMPRYRIRANTLWFLPTPNAVYNIQLHFVPTLGDIDDGANLLDGQQGWDDYVVLRSAIKCLAKEESDTSALQLELNECRDRIMTMVTPRDVGKPHRITDVALIHDGHPRLRHGGDL